MPTVIFKNSYNALPLMIDSSLVCMGGKFGGGFGLVGTPAN